MLRPQKVPLVVMEKRLVTALKRGGRRAGIPHIYILASGGFPAWAGDSRLLLSKIELHSAHWSIRSFLQNALLKGERTVIQHVLGWRERPHLAACQCHESRELGLWDILPPSRFDSVSKPVQHTFRLRKPLAKQPPLGR